MKSILATKLYETKEEKLQFLFIMAVSAVITAIMAFTFPMVLADGDKSGVEAIISTVKIVVTILASVAGAIYFIVGLVMFGLAQSEGDGPEQNKAIKKIATAVILEVIAFVVIPSIDLSSLIKTDAGK